jgi:hypothetical protein
MGNLGGLGKVKMGVLMERIYWIEKVGGRGRKEGLWEGLGIVVRNESWY